jgi:hypothetical protein
MIRKTLKTMLVALAAVFTLATMAEAAPKKVVHHRARHSTRVSSGSATTAKKHTTRKKTTRSASKSTKKRSTAKRTPSTKPR